MGNGKSKGKGCFKFGCFGCLMLLAISIGLVLLVGAIQLTTDAGDPMPEQRNVERALPPAPPLPNGALPPEAPATPGGELPTIAVAPLPADFDPSETRAGVLVLDLSMGDFIIQPGPPGEPIRVEADYDTNSFELAETFEQDSDGTWRYEIDFGLRGGWLGMLMRGGAQGHNRVTITIPRDQPMDIRGKIGMGQSEVDLGGLWVRDVDLKMGAGDHFLEFREPLRVPMASFKVDGSMGEVELRGLGDASPQEVRVEHGMGAVLVDLSGAWRNDSDVRVEFSMGECKLWLPEGDVNIDLKRASVSMGEKRVNLGDRDAVAGAPTLALNLSGSMGELVVKE